MQCKYCDNQELIYEKAVHINKTFHIIISCRKCWHYWHAPRDKTGYEMTKNLPWLHAADLLAKRKEYKRRRKQLQNKSSPHNDRGIKLYTMGMLMR